jgi:hypothetical protein
MRQAKSQSWLGFTRLSHARRAACPHRMSEPSQAVLGKLGTAYRPMRDAGLGTICGDGTLTSQQRPVFKGASTNRGRAFPDSGHGALRRSSGQLPMHA